MSDRTAFLIRRLRKSEAKTRAFFEPLTPEQWDEPVYTEGAAWSPRQILAHFVMAEEGINRLIANIIEKGEGVPEDFDLDAYNERKVDQASDMSPAQLLQAFRQARQQTVDMVTHLGGEDLDKTGRHPWLGVVRVEEIIKLIYRHNQIHQRDMRACLDI
jgi:hypothetical protein